MSLQAELAEAYVRVAELQSSNLGDAKNSIASFTKAVDIARTASSADPANAQRKLLLVTALSGLGRQESLSGQTESGHRHLDESSRILRTVSLDESALTKGAAAEGSGRDASYALELAVREGIVLGGLARNEGEYLRALTELRHALEFARSFRRVAPGDRSDYWESLVNWNLAIVQSQTGDLRAAHLTLDAASKTVAALAQRHPENAGYVRQVWVVRQAHALFAGSPRSINEGDYATSLDLYREAEALHHKAYLADEGNIRFHVDYIASNYFPAQKSFGRNATQMFWRIPGQENDNSRRGFGGSTR